MDNVYFSRDLHKVLIPAGHTGKLYLIDLVRYSRINHEVWVTEPEDKGKKQIEVFLIRTGDHPMLHPKMVITLPEGPESLTGDDQNNIWGCDPHHGQLLRYKDSYPRSR